MKRAAVMMLLAALASTGAGALDFKAIDEHLEYLDRPRETYHRELPRVDPETYLTSLIGVIATLEAALEANPNNPGILKRLGNAYRISASLPVEDFLRSFEGERSAQLNLPNSFQRLRTAVQYLEQAAAIAPRDAEIFLTLGRAHALYKTAEAQTKAADYLEKAKRLEGRAVSPFTLKWLAYLSLQSRQPERAFAAIEEYLRRFPADWEIFQPYMRAGYQLLLQNSERFPKQHSMVFLPADYDPDKRYPVLVDPGGLVMLFDYPWAGRPVSLKDHDPETAQQIRLDSSFKPNHSLIILIPMNYDSGQDIKTWEGFASLIESCEQRVLSDLERIERWYGIDRSRIVLCGSSLSADLSWALSNRHPDVFCGAVVHGSRCSYIDENGIRELAQRDARFYLTIAGDDLPVRVDGMENAKRLLDEAGVEHVYVKKASGGHSLGVLDLETAVDYLLFE